MATVTISLDGGGQLTVQTNDKTAASEMKNAFQNRQVGREFRITYADAVIIVPDGGKVLGATVSG